MNPVVARNELPFYAFSLTFTLIHHLIHASFHFFLLHFSLSAFHLSTLLFRCRWQLTVHRHRHLHTHTFRHLHLLTLLHLSSVTVTLISRISLHEKCIYVRRQLKLLLFSLPEQKVLLQTQTHPHRQIHTEIHKHMRNG